MEARLRQFLRDRITRRARARGVELPVFDGTTRLLEGGVVDSMGFLEIVTALENEFSLRLDFASADPDVLTTIDGLVAEALKAMDS